MSFIWKWGCAGDVRSWVMYCNCWHVGLGLASGFAKFIFLAKLQLAIIVLNGERAFDEVWSPVRLRLMEYRLNASKV